MHPIDIQPIWDFINSGLLILLKGAALCIGGYVVWLLHTKAPKFIDAQTQAKLAAIANQGLNMAIQYAMKTVTVEEAKIKPTFDSKVVQIAAGYAVNHIGGTLDKMGKSPADIAEMLVARFPPAPTVVDTTGETVTTTIVTTQPLAPIGATP